MPLPDLTRLLRGCRAYPSGSAAGVGGVAARAARGALSPGPHNRAPRRRCGRSSRWGSQRRSYCGAAGEPREPAGGRRRRKPPWLGLLTQLLLLAAAPARPPNGGFADRQRFAARFASEGESSTPGQLRQLLAGHAVGSFGGVGPSQCVVTGGKGHGSVGRCPPRYASRPRDPGRGAMSAALRESLQGGWRWPHRVATAASGSGFALGCHLCGRNPVHTYMGVSPIDYNGIYFGVDAHRDWTLCLFCRQSVPC